VSTTQTTPTAAEIEALIFTTLRAAGHLACGGFAVVAPCTEILCDCGASVPLAPPSRPRPWRPSRAAAR